MNTTLSTLRHPARTYLLAAAARIALGLGALASSAAASAELPAAGHDRLVSCRAPGR